MDIEIWESIRKSIVRAIDALDGITATVTREVYEPLSIAERQVDEKIKNIVWNKYLAERQKNQRTTIKETIQNQS